MNLRTFIGAAAILCAACTHSSEHPVAVAQIQGDQHVVVRAEAGRIWWQHRTWTEPHALWALPSGSQVENLAVTRDRDSYHVTFEQDGMTWEGSFGGNAPAATTLARSGSSWRFARSER